MGIRYRELSEVSRNGFRGYCDPIQGTRFAMLKLIGANEDNRRLADIDPFRVYAIRAQHRSFR
jgi:hypothetical protein